MTKIILVLCVLVHVCSALAEEVYFEDKCDLLLHSMAVGTSNRRLLATVKEALHPQTGPGFVILPTSKQFNDPAWLALQNDLVAEILPLHPLEKRTWIQDTRAFYSFFYGARDDKFASKLNSVGGAADLSPRTHPSLVELPAVTRSVGLMSKYRLVIDKLLRNALSSEYDQMELVETKLHVETTIRKKRHFRFLERLTNVQGVFHKDPTYLTVVTATNAAGTWVVDEEGYLIEVPPGDTVILSGYARVLGDSGFAESKVTRHALPIHEDGRMTFLLRYGLKTDNPDELQKKLNARVDGNIVTSLFYRPRKR